MGHGCKIAKISAIQLLKTTFDPTMSMARKFATAMGKSVRELL